MNYQVLLLLMLICSADAFQLVGYGSRTRCRHNGRYTSGMFNGIRTANIEDCMAACANTCKGVNWISNSRRGPNCEIWLDTPNTFKRHRKYRGECFQATAGGIAAKDTSESELKYQRKGKSTLCRDSSKRIHRKMYKNIRKPTSIACEFECSMYGAACKGYQWKQVNSKVGICGLWWVQPSISIPSRSSKFECVERQKPLPKLTLNPTVSPTVSISVKLTDIDALILQYWNDLRSAGGVACASGVYYKPNMSPLKFAEVLYGPAKLHSEYMASTGNFGHSEDGTTFTERAPYASMELIAYRGQSSRGSATYIAGRMLEQWQTSTSGHCDGLFSKSNKYFAISCIEYEVSSFYKYVCTAMLGNVNIH